MAATAKPAVRLPRLPKGQSVWLRKKTNGYLRGQKCTVMVTRHSGWVVVKVWGTKRATLLVLQQDLSIKPIEPSEPKRKPYNKKFGRSLGLSSIPSKASTKRRSRGRPGVVGGGLPGLGKRR